MTDFHQPVLVNETLHALSVVPNDWYIDATLGHGGHSLAILAKGAKVFGIEADPTNLGIARKRLSACPDASWHAVLGNYIHIRTFVQKKHISPIAGIVFDLGLASSHFSTEGRGFSFNDTKSLSMKLNPHQSGPSAVTIVNTWSQSKLEDMLTKLVQERQAKRISKLIVEARTKKEISTGKELGDLLSHALPQAQIHPATKTFLALKMLVNNDLANLKIALSEASKLLPKGGRLAVITFHSTEDRIVKQWGKKDPSMHANPLIKPHQNELLANPLARSSKLRVFTKQ